MWRSQETEHQSKREKKKKKGGFEGRGRERGSERKRQRRSAKAFREKRRLRYGKSLKEDLWFGKGVASA